MTRKHELKLLGDVYPFYFLWEKPLQNFFLSNPTAVPFHVEPDMTLQLCNLVVNLPGNGVHTTHKHIPWTTLTTCYCCGNVGVIVFVYRKKGKKNPTQTARFDSKRGPSISSKDVSWSKIRLEGGLDQINMMI